jgi:hypothetical protein
MPSKKCSSDPNHIVSYHAGCPNENETCLWMFALCAVAQPPPTKPKPTPGENIFWERPPRVPLTWICMLRTPIQSLWSPAAKNAWHVLYPKNAYNGHTCDHCAQLCVTDTYAEIATLCYFWDTHTTQTHTVLLNMLCSCVFYAAGVCGLNAYWSVGACKCNKDNFAVDSINCCRPNSVVNSARTACECKAGYAWSDFVVACIAGLWFSDVTKWHCCVLLAVFHNNTTYIRCAHCYSRIWIDGCCIQAL